MKKVLRYKFYTSRKFRGIGFIVKTNQPIVFKDQKSHLVEGCLGWVGFWITLDFYKQNVKIL